jgi:hypothetical protein
MTPLHQQLIDSLLTQAHQRTQELINMTGFPVGKTKDLSNEQRIELLRQSPLGLHLAAIANYAEGYAYGSTPSLPDVRRSVAYAGRAFFGITQTTTTYRFPAKFHKTQLGQLINDALTRFYKEERPGRLVPVRKACERFKVARQTVHEWIDAGRLQATYMNGLAYLDIQDVERMAQRRQHEHQDVQGWQVRDASVNVSDDA